MQFVLEAACGSDIGRIRHKNEDNYFFENKIRDLEDNDFTEPNFKIFEKSVVCFGVFDGIGGVDDGHIASHMAASVFCQDFEQVELSGMLSESFFNSTVTHMNEKVCVEAVKRKNKMGTTFVAVGFCENRIYLCNIGDSRAYRLRKNQLVQISKDHVEEIPPFMKRNRHIKTRLSQCIGIPSEELLIEPYVMQGRIKHNDSYLLCSDGITDMLTNEEISSILTNNNDAGMCVRLLIDSAMAHGGKDNATAIVVKVKEKIKRCKIWCPN